MFRHRIIVPLIAILLALAACSGGDLSFKGSDVTGVDWGRDISLTAHTGKPQSTADFHGRVQILFFGYTHCPDICSPTLAKLAAVRKVLGPQADKVQVVFVTVDPKHDTPTQLAGFLPQFDPTFVGLTGRLDDIVAVTKDHKVAFVPSTKTSPHPQIDHSSSILVKDAAGRVRLLWRGDMSVNDMTHDLRLLLARS